ncbi:tail fiber domain-containing protein [Candidatus Woesearchaeota archaeon]|nr:tail fiber domain-containing protein [Candidatus Woesearchaeota archaeon]
MNLLKKIKRGCICYILIIALFSYFASASGWNASKPSHETLYTDTITGKSGSLVSVQDDFELSKNNEVFINIKNTEANGRQWALVSAGSLGGIGLGKFSIYDKTAGLSRVSIDSSGNVGIGTTNPARRLHVVGGPLDNYQLRLESVLGKGTVIEFYQGTISRGLVTAGTHGVSIFNGNINPFQGIHLLQDTGYVGIGNAFPRAKLDVSGSGAKQCCAPIIPTVSLAEASNTANRQSWLQFHNEGEAEAYLRLAGGGPVGSGRDGQHRLEIGDSQNAGTSLTVTGKLGVGTTSPQEKVEIRQGFGDWIGLRAAQNNNLWHIHNPKDGDRLEIGRDNNWGLLVITNQNNVGIGTINPAYKLDVAGSIRSSVGGFVFPDGTVQTTAVGSNNNLRSGGIGISDISLKKNIKPITNASDKLMKLEGVYYEFKIDNKSSIGFIAQDFEKVLPELVYNDPQTGLKYIDYGRTVAILTEAIKEQRTMIDEMGGKIDNLNYKLNRTLIR